MQRLQEALELAVDVDDGPTVLRFSKDPLPAPLPALRAEGDAITLPKVLLKTAS